MITDLVISCDRANKLLEKYGSPLYVYNRDLLQNTITQITNSISYSNTCFYFACVTNGNLNLLQIFRDADWGIHGNTPGDVYLALKAGFTPQQIIYTGSNLNWQEMRQLLEWGVGTLNLDSISQVDLCCQVYREIKSKIDAPLLGLRLNLPSITGNSRIGVRPQEFKTAIELTEAAELQISGLHFYRGTGTNSTQAFTEVIDRLLEICLLLPDWSYLDFGGGFGYNYRHQKVEFDWKLFGDKLTKKLNKIEKDIKLIIEPGRAAIASCGKLLTKIVSVKWQGTKQIIGTDTSIANLAVLSVHGGYREIVSYRKNTQLYVTDVCGNTTYSRDYLGQNCQLPALKVGDTLAILDVGAYGYAMSSHFLHRLLPAEVLLEDNKDRLIRRRDDYSNLINNQIYK